MWMFQFVCHRRNHALTKRESPLLNSPAYVHHAQADQRFGRPGSLALATLHPLRLTLPSAGSGL
jgi:hypothetical protein